MHIKIGNDKYDVVITRKNNRNTYLRVKDDLKIHVTTHYLVNDAAIEKILSDNAKYIKASLLKFEQKKQKIIKPEYLGKELDININIEQKKPFFDGETLFLKDINEIDNWYKSKAEAIFLSRLDYIYSKFEEKIPYPVLKIRFMKTRWGVCNKRNRTVTLNANLIKKDLKYLDYVIVHELAHFVHFNHSSKFWDLVAKYVPYYKDLKKELKE